MNYKKKNDEIAKSKNLLSEKELNDKIILLRKEAKTFEQTKIKKINEINKKRATELNKFLQLIRPVIAEYMKEWTKHWGEDGILADAGMVPMPDEEQASFEKAMTDLPKLTADML